jgi:hypothetical protein
MKDFIHNLVYYGLFYVCKEQQFRDIKRKICNLVEVITRYFSEGILLKKYSDEELESKLWLITQCLAEMREYISPEYKSRAYELLMLNFSAKEIKLLDEYLFECIKTDISPKKNEFIEKVIEITNGLPFNEASADRLLLAYQNEELFLKVVNKILES